MSRLPPPASPPKSTTMLMKRFLLLLLFSVFLLFGLKGQEAHAHFLTDIEEARQTATEKNIPILMVFAGSDWCRPCMQFKQQVLADEAFQSFADTALVVLYLDFPAKKKNQLPPEQLKQNEALAERFNKSGAFPHILLMNHQEEIIAPIGYHQQTADVFIREINMARQVD